MHNRRLPRLLMAAALGVIPILSAALSFAQVPPPVPALPDAERRTQYAISGSTCACAVNFALFGSGTDVDSWIEVWISGTRYLSTDPSHGWALTSATGTLATIPRPITNAVLTFAVAQTGTVQIVGAERPRRLSQFQENAGVPARALNQALTDIIAQNRETWDKTNDVTGRALLLAPGQSGAVVPAGAAGQNKYVGTDGSGNFALLGNTATQQGATGAAGTNGTNGTNGVLSNTRLAKTANYTVANVDKGSTIALGGAASFTLTFNAASGYDANFMVLVVNEGTTRAMPLAINGLSSFFLYPGQTAIVFNQNNVWQVTKPPLWAPSGAVTFFVDNVNGSDSNDCLAAGSGNACLTSAQAMTLVATMVNNINGVTIQWASGSTYTSQFTAQGYNGPGSITLDGNSSALNPTAPTGGCVICIGSPNQNGFGSSGHWNIRRFTLSSPTAGVYGVVCSAYSACDMLDGMVFSTLSSTGSAYSCTQGSRCTCANNFTVSAAAILNVLDSSDFSIMKCQNQTITLSANPLAVSGATVSVHGGGLADVVGVTWSVPNSVTGTRYKADLMGIIDSGACNSIPGNAGGQPTSGTLGTSGGFCN